MAYKVGIKVLDGWAKNIVRTAMTIRPSSCCVPDITDSKTLAHS